MTQVVPLGRLYISPVPDQVGAGADRRYSAAPRLPYTVCRLQLCHSVTCSLRESSFPAGEIVDNVNRVCALSSSSPCGT